MGSGSVNQHMHNTHLRSTNEWERKAEAQLVNLPVNCKHSSDSLCPNSYVIGDLKRIIITCIQILMPDLRTHNHSEQD